MNYFFGNIPLTQLIVYTVVGLLLLLFFNVVGRYIVPLFEKTSSFVGSIWPKIQIITWVVYSVLFYSALLSSYTGVTLIFTIIVLGLLWEYWKNILSGVLIKFTSQFKLEDFISTEIVRGTVVNIYLARTELINEKGELVMVPNNQLRNSVVTHLHKTHDVNICAFTVKAGNSETLEDLYQMAHNCPYIAVNQDIAVERKTGEEWVVKATIIDNSFIEHANRYFRGGK